MASEWNLGVWLPCIGVVSVCCCKEVYRYSHNNKLLLFPTPLVLALFLAAASLLLCSFLKCFFRSCFCYFLQYIANVTQRTFEIVQKNPDHANIII